MRRAAVAKTDLLALLLRQPAKPERHHSELRRSQLVKGEVPLNSSLRLDLVEQVAAVNR